MPPARLSNADLAALSAPTVIFAGYELTHRILLPAFLTQHVGLGMGLVGVMLLVLRLLDIAFDTLVGGLSDTGVGGTLGRRRLWMLLGLPLALAGMAGAFSLQPGSSSADASGWLFLMMVGWAAINSAHGAWALESATGVEQRSRVFVARGMAGVSGFLVFSALAAATGPDIDAQLLWMLGAILIGAPLTTVLLFLRVPETPSPPRMTLQSSIRAMLAPLYLGFTTGSRRWLSLLFGLVGAHAAIATGSYVFVVKDSLGVADAVGPGLVCQSLAMIVGMPILLHLLRRTGPRSILALIFAAELLISIGSLFLPSGQAIPAIAWAGLRGFVSGMEFAVLRALAGQEMDNETGADAHAAGGFYAAFHLPYNLANALAIGALFLAYDNMDALGDLFTPARGFLVIPAVAGALISLAALTTALHRTRPATASRQTPAPPEAA
jgi:GPH family glycoside/pentoside/hexuronide:cation symporter